MTAGRRSSGSRNCAPPPAGTRVLSMGSSGRRPVAPSEKLQGEQSLVRDGVVGPDTWSALLAAQPLVRLGSRGRPVQELQQLLVASGFDPGPLDGVFGPLTDTAVRSLQGSHRLGHRRHLRTTHVGDARATRARMTGASVADGPDQ